MNSAKSRASPELSGEITPDLLTPPPTKHKHSAADQSEYISTDIQTSDDSVLQSARSSLVVSEVGGADNSEASRESFESIFSIADDIIDELSITDDDVCSDKDVALEGLRNSGNLG